MRRRSFQTSPARADFNVAALTAPACSPASAKGPSRTVMIDEYQPAYMLCGNMGGGKLYFQGSVYDFKIGADRIVIRME